MQDGAPDWQVDYLLMTRMSTLRDTSPRLPTEDKLNKVWEVTDRLEETVKRLTTQDLTLLSSV